MNIEYFKYLEEVTRCGSIRQAANKLHLKQQNLSAVVKNIESYYDLTLFERSHKGISLTEDGKFFMERVAKIHALLEELESPYLYPSKRDHQYVVQDLSVYIQSLVSSKTIAVIVDEFHKFFPYVHINLIVENCMEDVLAAVQDRSEKNRLGLVYTLDDGKTFQTSLASGLAATHFARGALTAVTGKNNQEAQRMKEISIYDLLKKELVLYSSEGTEGNFFYELLKRYGEPNIKYVTNNSMFQIELLQQSDYWTLGRVESEDKLITLPLKEEINIQSYFVYDEAIKDSFTVQSFFKIAYHILDASGIMYV